MVRFIFIRHGLSCSNITQGDKLHTLLGVRLLDPGLDDVGVKDVRQLSKTFFIRNLKPFKKMVFVSPMSRALQTAVLLFKGHGNVNKRFLKISKNLHELYPVTPSNRNMKRAIQNTERSEPFTKLAYNVKGNIIAESTVSPIEKGVYTNKSGNLLKFMKNIMKTYCDELHNSPDAEIVVVTHGALMIRDLELNKKRDNLNNMVYLVEANYIDKLCDVSKKKTVKPIFRGFTYDIKKFDPIVCKRFCPYWKNDQVCDIRKNKKIYARPGDY